MPTVLFVCTANRFRSPLAAAIFSEVLNSHKEPGDWTVASAGTWTTPGQPVLSQVHEVAQRMGYDLSGHRSMLVDRQLLSEYDLVMVMEPGQIEALQNEFPDLRGHIYLLSQVVEYQSYLIPDQFDSVQEVLETAELLQTLITKGLRQICSLAVSLHNHSKN
ncbi:MAG: hypothetical protein ABI904_01375 [Chloroflexota bacterium]